MLGQEEAFVRRVTLTLTQPFEHVSIEFGLFGRGEDVPDAPFSEVIQAKACRPLTGLVDAENLAFGIEHYHQRFDGLQESQRERLFFGEVLLGLTSRDAGAGQVPDGFGKGDILCVKPPWLRATSDQHAEGAVQQSQRHRQRALDAEATEKSVLESRFHGQVAGQYRVGHLQGVGRQRLVTRCGQLPNHEPRFRAVRLPQGQPRQ